MPLSARAPLTPDLAQAEPLAALSARLDLARAQVMYGSSPGQYSQALSVPVATMTSVAIEALEAGRTWYFTVKAVNTSGVESDFSNEVSKLL